MHARRRLALGHVPGTIDPHEAERDPRGARTLQCGQAVADRLVPGGVEGHQTLDVVPEVLRGVEKPLVRHQDGGREVVGQAAQRQRLGGGGAEGAVGDELVEQVTVLEEGQLRGHAERLLTGGQMRGQVEPQLLGREPVPEPVGQIDTAGHPHVVRLRQAVLEFGAHIATVHPDPVGEFLGGGVQRIDVVLALIEVVPHLLVRHRQRGMIHLVGERVAVLGERRQQVGRVPVALVEYGEGPGQRRVCPDQIHHIGGRDPRGHLGVGQGLGELGDQAGVGVRGEERRVDPVHLRQRRENTGGDGPGVLLQLVEIAGRQPQRGGERGLGQAVLLAEAAQSRAHVCGGHPGVS